jgi:succinyl-CoA synthetase alpha subunit
MIAAMEAADIRVSPSPARLGKTLVELLSGEVAIKKRCAEIEWSF